jgi:hypothetical protein
MKRKGRVSIDKHSHVLEMQRNGYGVRAISKSLHMCKRTVRKYLLLPSESIAGTAVNQLNSVSIEGMPAEQSLRERIFEASRESPQWFRELDLEHLVTELSKGVSYKTLYNEVNITAKYWSF